ncbi:hypothetical protein CKO36_04080 [Rhabdochromatium marinum]|nr:hypothetical protein [Rhabdochromatium marinum]
MKLNRRSLCNARQPLAGALFVLLTLLSAQTWGVSKEVALLASAENTNQAAEAAAKPITTAASDARLPGSGATGKTQSEETAADKIASASDLAEVIGARVKARWRALMARDFTEAYKYESPAFRKLNDLESFSRRYGDAAKWTDVELVSVDLNDTKDLAKVILMVSYVAVLPNATTYNGRRRVDEKWLKVDDQWWFSRQ